MDTEFAARRDIAHPTSAEDVGVMGSDGHRRVDASYPWRCDVGLMAWRVVHGRVDVFWASGDGRGRRMPLRSFDVGDVLTSLAAPIAEGALIALAVPGTIIEPSRPVDSTELSQLARKAAAHDLSDEVARLAYLDTRDQQQVTEVAAQLSTIESGRPTFTGEPIVDAVRMLCASEGVSFSAQPYDPSATFAVQVQSLLNNGRVRSRSVTLEGRWWTRDGDAFIAYDHDGSLVVVLPQYRWGPPLLAPGARYLAISAATGTSRPVNDVIGSSIGPDAIVVQRVMAPGPVQARDLMATARRSWRREFAWTTLLAFGASMMTLLVPIALGKIIGLAVPSYSTNALATLILILGCAGMGLFIFELTRNLTLLRLGGELDRNLLPAVWDRVLRLPTNFFRHYEVGELTNRIMGIDQARQIIGESILVTGLAAVFAVVNLILVAASVPALVLPALGVIAVFLAVCASTWWIAQKFNRAAAVAQGDCDALALQLVQGVGKIRVAGATATMFRRWVDLMSAGQRAQLKASLRWDITSVAAFSLPLTASLAVYVAAMTESQPVDVAQFAVFATALGMATGMAGAILIAVGRLGRVWVLIDRAEPILSAPTEDIRSGRALRITGDVTFTDVHFRYSENTPLVLDGFSLTIPAGSFTALVGASGCGKSTVLRCLLGFEQPERGAVFLDGMPLDELDLGVVRRQFGVVMQKFSLMGGSILENIIGGRDLTTDDAWAASESVGLAEFIRSLPMGMHTMLMDGAGTLSGGQVQRLLLARAIAGRPRLIVLDEATSALDNPTQLVVTESLARMSVTRLVVAHRLSTVQGADQIAVLDAGRVVELGTHDELMALGGHYRGLVERQL